MNHIKPHRWNPGLGPSADAIERMREHFTKPSEPMGEAWFMSQERRMYPELWEPEVIRDLDILNVTEILREITSGTKCFGHMEEWDEWFKYLLPDLIERGTESLYWEQLLLQSVISSFMSIYWNGIEEEYEGYRDDIMNTLPLCLMAPELWEESKAALRPSFLHLFKDGAGRDKLMWNWSRADGNVSATIFFCMKYLRGEEIPEWVRSFMEIPDPLWQGNLAVWFLGVWELLGAEPIMPSAVEKAHPEISWEGSSSLGSTATSEEIDSFVHLRFNDNRRFVPTENARFLLTEMRNYYSEAKILELSDVFSQDPHVVLSTYRVPERLYALLHGRRR